MVKLIHIKVFSKSVFPTFCQQIILSLCCVEAQKSYGLPPSLHTSLLDLSLSSPITLFFETPV